ncbi:hypothetical protein QYF61_019888 [Mycteria americana]|uniref:Uncharacterized protein n=1 Tax=Mycteria americana TaxID=33587 RepID=A0AAN7Q624_MYCAM|nr:hypothetical protein QYF61_019888 [Mycteria americana]
MTGRTNGLEGQFLSVDERGSQRWNLREVEKRSVVPGGLRGREPEKKSSLGHLQLDQVAQSPSQPDLEWFQGWAIYHLSGQPVPVFHHPHGKKKVFLGSSLNLPSFSLPLSYHNRPC